MIGFIRGKLVVKTPPHLTVDVGGVGYDIEAPLSTFYTLPAIGSEVRLLTHLVVRGVPPANRAALERAARAAQHRLAGVQLITSRMR